MVTGDDPIVDLLNLFRGEPSRDSFYNVLVISLTVETAVDGLFIDTRLECCIVIVDDGEVLAFVVLEDYYPVIGEDFAVICN